MSPEPRGHIKVPALWKTFYGVTHQFASGEKTVALTAGQLNVSDTVVMGGSVPFVIVARAGIWSPATAEQGKIRVKANRKDLFSDACFLATFGTGRYPQYLPKELVLDGGADFVVTLDDRQTVTTAITARFLHYGYLRHNEPVQAARFYSEAEPWRYVADFTAEGPNAAAVTASGSISLPINIDQDGDFQVYKVTLVSDGAFKVQISNSDRHQDWFWPGPVHAQLLGGVSFGGDPSAGAWPFRLPESVPEFVSAGSSLKVAVSDISAATNRVQVIFDGRKLKPAGGFALDASLNRRVR